MSNICKEAYCITQSKAPFDWNEFLEKTEYTREEIEKACDLSKNWTTCACGNQCSKIPRYIEGNFIGAPKDNLLLNYGTEFYDKINGMRYSYDNNLNDRSLYYKKEAIKYLQKIEERSTQLLKEIKDCEY